jgi:RNA polymerase sigma factor
MEPGEPEPIPEVLPDADSRESVDSRAVLAKDDPRVFEDLVVDYRPYILSCASRVCMRRIDPDNDEEFSTAMLAFYEAVRQYDPERGSFLSFVRSVIRTRLIDGFRSAGRHPPAQSIDEETEDEEGYHRDPTVAASVDAFERETQTSERREEIGRFSAELGSWNLTFRDLADASPKASKTKTACGLLVREMLLDENLQESFRKSRQLPLAILCERAGIPRKIADRHRRYIVSAVLVLTGEYPYMAEHLRWMRTRK